ncbi:MAG: hypothetical protein AAFY17_02530 [Cyanobacteria bacterium J06642_11]
MSNPFASSKSASSEKQRQKAWLMDNDVPHQVLDPVVYLANELTAGSTILMRKPNGAITSISPLNPGSNFTSNSEIGEIFEAKVEKFATYILEREALGFRFFVRKRNGEIRRFKFSDMNTNNPVPAR